MMNLMYCWVFSLNQNCILEIIWIINWEILKKRGGRLIRWYNDRMSVGLFGFELLNNLII